MPDFEMATHTVTGFLLRYVALRMEPVQLWREAARPPIFSLAARPAGLIMGTGHGSPTTFTGQNAVPLWEVSKYNPAECQGKIIKLLSCLTGQRLGPDLIHNGARAYQGYSEDFVFFADDEYLLHPWDDPLASLYLKPAIEAMVALIQGRTCQEAFDIERAGYDRSIASSADPLITDPIKFDRDHMVMLGDPQARVGRF